jgi:hypothetical protein
VCPLVAMKTRIEGGTALVGNESGSKGPNRLTRTKRLRTESQM